ncbi:accessory Sec system protein translocase subunit SecY2 [Limosilactobacillus sp.]|jgi:preprotein translocase subunit SecY|uniref:accessory Sec system protein translocase subunit SecY2 n=1 Tax=Limosilactobacillus sp. TaxID=2773925 RepID=UPI0025BE3C37|nr:accessory Sec system protein translocase subunit SecY2 [Limosilactobacillus sp.]MCH3922184.1 accessory Sec system protein translocase subunit SecY2 [Limosilactobacillus sp.]MCH3928955.1 accessory Sec system protein translocase subunit SecY2 [Limosilactobacillus sp.]
MKKPYQLNILRDRVAFSLFVLLIYILGSSIPLPFVRMTEMYRNMLAKTPIGLMSFMGGANLQTLSLFSVGLNPLMIAMMIVQLMSMTKLFWTDSLSQHQTMIVQQWLMLILATVQAIAITLTFHLTANYRQATAVVIILVAGSMLVVWLGFMNMQFGIGGTMTLILFNMISGSIQPLVRSIKRMQVIPHAEVWLAMLILVGLVEIIFWVGFNRAYYRASMIDVTLKSSVKPLAFPIALNLGGMMTYMMGMAILTLPMILAQTTSWREKINDWHFQVVFCMVVTFLLFYFFAYLQLNPKDQAKELRNKNNYILDVRPGKPTSRFIRNHLLWLSLPGALLNGAQLTLGLVGSQFLGRYTAFALIPLDVVMIVMFMNLIKDQLLVLVIPHRYEKLMKKEG